MKTIEINLDLPPEERWEFASEYREDINQLITCYRKDIEDYEGLFREMVDAYKEAFVPLDYIKEIETIAKHCDYDVNQVLFANLYYDIVKFAFACTAYACYESGAVWHARNLDWWTENDALKKFTKRFRYTRNGQTVFESVGWVGFAGVLSGCKPGRSAVTLNAILSEDSPNIAKPISFLLREILENENTFETAKQILEKTEIVCDCLLLLSGTQKDEMVVIERTPTRSAIRQAENDCIIVTNDYKKLSDLEVESGNVLNATFYGRYEQTEYLLQKDLPKTAKECYDILNDSEVKMGITVQQMVFNAGKGTVDIF